MTRLFSMLLGALVTAGGAPGDECPASPALREAHARPRLAPGERPWAMAALPARPSPAPVPAAALPVPHSEARRHLLRRLTFVLSGLPPREDDAGAFLADPSPRALDTVLGRLLADSTAAQRLAEVWLRATGHADRWPDAPAAAGAPPGEAWRYRDWLVSSLRSSPDPSRLARLTLAGDSAAGSEPGAPNPSGLTATMWHLTAAPPTTDYEETVVRWAGRQAERTAQAFLGLDLSCASCHDHPALPLPTIEAAGLVSIFAHSHAYVRGPDGTPTFNRVSTATPTTRKKRAGALAAIAAAEAVVDGMRHEFALLTAAEFLPQTAEYVRAAWAWHQATQGSRAAFAASRGLLEAPLEHWGAALGLGGDPPAHSMSTPWWAGWVHARAEGTPAAIAAAARVIQDSHTTDKHSPFFNPSPAMDAFFTLDQQTRLARQAEKAAALRRRLPDDPQIPALAEGAPPGLEPPALPPQLPTLLTRGARPMEIIPPAAGRRALATWLEGEGATFFTRLAALRLAEGLGHSLLPEPSGLGLWASARPAEAAALDAVAARLRTGGWPAAAREVLRLQAAAPPRPPLRLGGSEWRDAVLFVTGRLDPRQGGPPDPAPDSPRRGLYREWAPLPPAPTEAFLHAHAAALADLARQKAGTDPAVQLTFITFRLFQRQPTAAERAERGGASDLAARCAQFLTSEEFRSLP